MKKFIAVLTDSSNILRTKEWLINDIIGAKKLKLFLSDRLEFEDTKDNRYIIIYRLEQGMAMEFNSYIVFPEFKNHELEDFIQTRIKR